MDSHNSGLMKDVRVVNKIELFIIFGILCDTEMDNACFLVLYWVVITNLWNTVELFCGWCAVKIECIMVARSSRLHPLIPSFNKTVVFTELLHNCKNSILKIDSRHHTSFQQTTQSPKSEYIFFLAISSTKSFKSPPSTFSTSPSSTPNRWSFTIL